MLRPLFFLSAASSVNSSAASMRVAMSANLKAMAWKLEMDFPNCSRSWEYFTLASNAPLAMPRERAAMEILPPSSTFMAWMKPSPILPRT